MVRRAGAAVLTISPHAGPLAEVESVRAAAEGRRGDVEVRDAGDKIHLTGATTRLAMTEIESVIEVVPARHLTACSSLREAERMVKEHTSISEIEYETAKAQRRPEDRRTVTVDDLPKIDHVAERAGERGCDYVSTRRLAELLGATTSDAFAALGSVLMQHRRGRYEPSLLATALPRRV